jgi:LPS sulfotransferase NodH
MDFSIKRYVLPWRTGKPFGGQGGQPTLFVLASMPRSGTHMLRSMLNGHPNVRTANELFNPQSVHCHRWFHRSPAWVVEKKAWYGGRQKIRGFLLHLCQNEPWKIWEHLHTLDNMRYICMRRGHLLEQYVSLQQAEMHGRWQATREEDRPELRPMHIDPQFAEIFFSQVLAYWRRFEQEFSEKPRFTVWYEELCSNTETMSRQVQQFLGANTVSGLQSSTIKVGRPVDKLISNYAELQRYFRGSKFEYLFQTLPFQQSKIAA